MARPAKEWPIPAYVAEYRERLVFLLRLPTAAVAERLPGGLEPLRCGEDAFMAVTVAVGRCLRAAGGSGVLAAEFGLESWLIPVRYRPACGEAASGVWLDRLGTDHAGLRRFIPAALRRPVDASQLSRECRGRALSGRVCGEAAVRLRYALGVEEAEPSTLVDAGRSPEAEAAGVVLAAEQCFASIPGRERAWVIPVQQYARATTSAEPLEWEAAGVADDLHVTPAELRLSLVLRQRRYSQTWFFPTEIIGFPRSRTPAIAPRELFPTSGAVFPQGTATSVPAFPRRPEGADRLDSRL